MYEVKCWCGETRYYAEYSHGYGIFVAFKDGPVCPRCGKRYDLEQMIAAPTNKALAKGE